MYKTLLQRGPTLVNGHRADIENSKNHGKVIGKSALMSALFSSIIHTMSFGLGFPILKSVADL